MASAAYSTSYGNHFVSKHPTATPAPNHRESELKGAHPPGAKNHQINSPSVYELDATSVSVYVGPSKVSDTQDPLRFADCITTLHQNSTPRPCHHFSRRKASEDGCRKRCVTFSSKSVPNPITPCEFKFAYCDT